MNINKQKLFKILEKRIKKEITITERSFNSAIKAFREAPSSLRTRSDTTRAEQDRMQAICQRRLNELKKGIIDLKKLVSIDSVTIKEGSLVVCGNNNQETYWIVNIGAGENLKVDNKEIKTISSNSPLGQVLLGRKEGDIVEFKLDGNDEGKKLKIIEVK